QAAGNDQAVDVDLLDAFPVGQADIFGAAHFADPGVGLQNIEPSVFGHDGLHGILHGLRVGHVSLQRHAFAAQRLHSSQRIPGRVEPGVQHAHRGAVTRQCRATGLADAPAGAAGSAARHQGHFAGQARTGRGQPGLHFVAGSHAACPRPTVMPPHTYSTWPVMKPARSSSSDATAWATSAGVPMRCTGMLARIFSVCGAPGGLTRSNSSVAMGPGPIALTVMPSAAVSSAQVRVMPSRPALVAAYTVRAVLPRAARLDTLTTRPNLRRRMAGSRPCSNSMGAWIFNAVTIARSSGVASSSRPGRTVPALFTR